MEIDFLLESASSGHSKTAVFGTSILDFIFQHWRLLLCNVTTSSVIAGMK